jgi:formamidopyrimidine-DNA glycosylase
MIELPEAYNLAKQINEKVIGKKISRVIAASSPHKFAWYCGDPKKYNSMLKGKIIQDAYSYGGLVELKLEDARIVVGDGVGLRYHSTMKTIPQKHQFLAQLEDDTFLSASIQMYGGIYCFLKGSFDNKYYLLAKEKPSPLGSEFSKTYFNDLISASELKGKSVKYVLATEQRIPGLGNGVLQDILFKAKINPRRKIATLSNGEINGLYKSVKAVLKEMSVNRGRDTEKDLFGNEGGYFTRCSKKTVGKPCTVCKSEIVKENYMGGSVYFCPICQKL